MRACRPYQRPSLQKLLSLRATLFMYQNAVLEFDCRLLIHVYHYVCPLCLCVVLSYAESLDGDTAPARGRGRSQSTFSADGAGPPVLGPQSFDPAAFESPDGPPAFDPAAFDGESFS